MQSGGAGAAAGYSPRRCRGIEQPVHSDLPSTLGREGPRDAIPGGAGGCHLLKALKGRTDVLPFGAGGVSGFAMYEQLDAVLQPATSGVLIAYIGPGAGIALVGSFLAVFLAILSAIGIILTWPIRRIWRALRGRRAPGAGPRPPRRDPRAWTASTRSSPNSSSTQACCRTWRSFAARAPIGGSARAGRRSRRWPGRASRPERTRAGTTSSTSSRGTRRPMARSFRRSGCGPRGGRSDWARTSFPCRDRR